jgi:hypothetical protein
MLGRIWDLQESRSIVGGKHPDGMTCYFDGCEGARGGAME